MGRGHWVWQKQGHLVSLRKCCSDLSVTVGTVLPKMGDQGHSNSRWDGWLLARGRKPTWRRLKRWSQEQQRKTEIHNGKELPHVLVCWLLGFQERGMAKVKLSLWHVVSLVPAQPKGMVCSYASALLAGSSLRQKGHLESWILWLRWARQGQEYLSWKAINLFSQQIYILHVLLLLYESSIQGWTK